MKKSEEDKLRNKIRELRSIFARASVGDYSEDVEIPDGDDEFTELAMGVQIMLEVIRERIRALEEEIKDRRTIEEKMRHQALHDSVTGLPNRLDLEEKFKAMLSHAKRSNEIIAVLYVDLDFFKKINDNFGHSVGDQVLKVIASRIKDSIRQDDIVARIGGDEFIIILNDIKASFYAGQVANKIIKALIVPMKMAGHTMKVSASVGVSIFPADGDNMRSLLAKADHALLKAKQEGRSRYYFYNESSETKLKE